MARDVVATWNASVSSTQRSFYIVCDVVDGREHFFISGDSTRAICNESVPRLGESETRAWIEERVRQYISATYSRPTPTGPRGICVLCGEVIRIQFSIPDSIHLALSCFDVAQGQWCLQCFCRLADEAFLKWDNGIQFFPLSLHTILNNKSEALSADKR